MSAGGPSVTLLYHFFHPDDVISARQFAQLAEGLHRRGWSVTVLASDRYCRYPGRTIEPREETWRGIRILRSPRPGFDQAGSVSRLANALVLMGRWSARLRALPPQDVVVAGTDPQFLALLFPRIRRMHPSAALVHWCHDLYPEAVMADTGSPAVRWAAGRLRPAMRRAYRAVDLMADIGPCMRARLDRYGHGAARATLTPWALVEPEAPRPPDPDVRRALFGDAALGLLYSGNMGRAHDFADLLGLARAVRRLNPAIVFAFACRGNRAAELKAAVRPDDVNVRLADFCAEEDLDRRLGAADIHLLSLRPEWEGIVVPSKFFGAIAVGRPVLYAGPRTSSVAAWIAEFDLGLCLDGTNTGPVAAQLARIAADPAQRRAWQDNALRAYRERFARSVQLDAWDRQLRDWVARR